MDTAASEIAPSRLWLEAKRSMRRSRDCADAWGWALCQADLSVPDSPELLTCPAAVPACRL